MKIKVDVNNLTIIEKSDIHKGEYNVNKCIFEFSSEYTKDLIYRAVFSCINGSYYQLILNNECNIPEEILREKDVNIELGVYAYILNDDNELELRYSPKPTYFRIENGSYKDADKTEVPSPTDYEKFLNEFNRNAANKTEDFNKNYEDKIKAYNDNSIQKTNEYNKNADEKIKEINNKVSDVEKIEENIEQIQKNVQASEQNAKDSEISAQNSAKKSSESESNIISIEKNINDLKKDIDNTKTQIDEKAKEVKNNSDIAIEQAKVATEQATLSGQNANKTSADKEDISQMKVSIEASEDNIEEIEKNVQAIKDDIEADKNEILEAKEEVENSLENERIISDKKYARAIDSEIVEINEFGQVECDNDGYAKDLEIDSTLSEITQDTREGYNHLELTLETQSINGLDITVNSDKSITLNGTLTNNVGIFISDFKNMQAGKFTSVMNSNQALTNKDYYIDYRDSNAIRYGITKFSDKLKVFELSESNDIRALLWIGTGITLKNLTIKPMLIEGEYTEDNLPIYEQYGASPSLNYPSEFKNLKNELSITNNQENYFNTTQIANRIFSTNGLTVTTDENGIFTVNGTHSEQVNIDFSNLDFKLRNGQKFKLINIDGQSDVSSNIIDTLRVLVWDKDFNDVGQVNSSINKIEGGTVNRARVRFLIPSNKTSVKYNNFKFGIMVVDDESIENYVPYNGYSKQITLPENKFLGTFNSYKNYIKDNKLKSNLEIVEFTETLDWTYHEPENKFMCSILSNAKIKDISLSQLCSHYKTKSDFASNENEFACTVNGFMFHNDNNMSLEEWKAFLTQQKEAGTPLQILYISSNEEEISLEDINLPLYKGINNISAEDLKVSFKYNVSIEKYIEENNVNEHKISDNKYARALKTQVRDVEQTQIYAENDEVDDLVIKGTPLTQKTREGYNLVDFKSPDEIYVSDFNFQNDILTITSSSGTFRQIMYDITNLMLTNAGKVLSFWYSNVDFSQGNSPAVQITLTKNDNTKSYTQLLSASLVKSNFNIPDNISEYSSLKLGILCNNTSESINASITITKPMLLIGTEEKTYEQYGSSPSLDFPSEVEVEKQQNISINGKNKCRGWMNTTSTVIYETAFLIKADLKPNTKYTISFLTPNFEAKYYRAEELTSNWFTVINNGKRQSFTFTTKADISNAYKEYNGEYGYLLFKNAMATPSPANFSDVMLVEGDTDVPYEAYYGHDVNIPLTNSSIGNYFDVIDRENKVQDKVIQELILTGNENYNFNNVENGIYQYSITPAKKPIYINDSIIRAMSNYFKGVGRDGSWNIDNSITTNMSNIRFMTSQYTTVEDFKVKIKELYEAGTPVKVYYVAETADKISLSEKIKQELDKFELYDGLNNIFIDNGTLSFKYNKSLLRAFEEQSELSARLLERIQALEQAQVNQVGGN